MRRSIIRIYIKSFFIVSVVTLKTIHVSHNEESKDNSTCGQQSQPCYHLYYAINTISMTTDTILLDANYKYKYNRSVEVPHSLKLTSYYNNSGGDLNNNNGWNPSANPPMRKAFLNITLLNSDEHVSFKVYGDLSLTNINISIDAQSLESFFQVQNVEVVKRIEIHDSVIHLFGRSGNTDILSAPYNIDIKLNKTKLFYHLIDQQDFDEVNQHSLIGKGGVMTSLNETPLSRKHKLRSAYNSKKGNSLAIASQEKLNKDQLTRETSSTEHWLHSGYTGKKRNPSAITSRHYHHQKQPKEKILNESTPEMHEKKAMGNDGDYKLRNSNNGKIRLAY